MDAVPRGGPQRARRLLDVAAVAAREAADDRSFDLARYGVHRVPIARRRCRETRLDDVDA